jgi:hypothetical protein
MLVGGAVLTLVSLPSAHAAEAVLLGTADSFAVLAGSGITNTGPTSITGDVGTFPTSDMTGFDSVTLDGEDHGDDAVTQQAKVDLVTAYDQAAGTGPTTAVATELGGLTLTPGVYGNETLGITGTLTLDTLGDPHAVFIFQADTTLITATDSEVVVLGGGEACNVFWQVGSSATLGTRSHLVGSVLAAMSITATTEATVQGRLLALDGAVTLDTNTLTRATCTDVTTTTTGNGSTTSTTAAGGSTSTTGSTGTVPTTEVTTAPTTSGPTSSVPGVGTPGTPGDDDRSAPPTETAGGPGSPGTPAGPGAPGGPPTSVPSGPTAPRLPYTGTEATALAAAGLGLLGLGIASRAWAARRHGAHAR